MDSEWTNDRRGIIEEVLAQRAARRKDDVSGLEGWAIVDEKIKAEALAAEEEATKVRKLEERAALLEQQDRAVSALIAEMDKAIKALKKFRADNEGVLT